MWDKDVGIYTHTFYSYTLASCVNHPKRESKLTKIYSYILKNDSGAAPNPFWGICTLTICKPAIRRTANIGDWVIGTGSKNSKLKDGTVDLSDNIIYAMVITRIKTLSEYDKFCKKKLKNKIPNWKTKDWRQKVW
jgi:hypothetical protein